jgi:16S rRNA pseudouridine516 synthase
VYSKRARLDRFISARTGLSRKAVRPVLAQGRIRVDGAIASGINQVIGQFSHVQLDNQVLQSSTATYVMLNKPAGVVSATRDERHKTVIDLLDRNDRNTLHIAGRLDFNSSGLLLLTNDGRWSRQLSRPEANIGKLYRVTLEHPITSDYVEAFTRGMYFDYEGITTRPAQLRIIDDHTAEVRLVEGRYHQIKRMFGRMRNPVRALHRSAVGNLRLDPALGPGQYWELTAPEVNNVSL